MFPSKPFSIILPYFPPLVSGFLLTACFPDSNLFYLAFAALVPLMVSMAGMTPGQCFYGGWVTGFTHYISLIYWIIPTLTTYGGLHPILALASLTLLSLYLGLYTAGFAFILKKLAPGPALFPLVSGLTWVSFEYIRTHALTGFPWGVLGYSQYSNRLLVQSADLGGVLGLSFMLVLCNASFALAWQQLNPLRDKSAPKKPGKKWLASTGFTLVLLAAALTYGNIRIQEMEKIIRKAPAPEISVIQGNIRQDQKWDAAFKSHTIEAYNSLSLAAAQSKPDLIIWPETALPFYYGRDIPHSNQIDGGVRRARTNFLVGSPAAEPDSKGFKYYNRAYMLNPLALVTGRYDKTHLVPFGEYIPLQDLLWFLDKLTQQAGNFSMGTTGFIPLEFKDHRTGVLICFEIIFPDIARKFVKNGADLLTTMTNDAWFGTTSAPGQHFAIGVLRAVENRRTVIRAANTGISGFIDPTGKILEQTGLFERLAISRRVPAIKEISLYTRYGDIAWILALVAISLGFMVKSGNNIFRRKRS